MIRICQNDPDEGVLRKAIAGWMAGLAVASPAEMVEAYGVDGVLAAIEREGVVSLVYARLSEPGGGLNAPESLCVAIAALARHAAARSLLRLAEARRIQLALDDAGIHALWLKGMALGHWLYPQPHLRDTADIDLLLPDHRTTLDVAHVLAPLGYALPNPHIAGDLVVHELLAWSDRARVELDLHWDVSNGALFAGRLPWQALWSGAQPVPALGKGAFGLGDIDALLHACMHRAANHLTAQEFRLRWLLDIHLLAGVMSPPKWQALALRAQQARLADACLDGLQATAEVFETCLPPDVLELLTIAARSEAIRSRRLGQWSYFQRATWRALPDLRSRLRWLRQLLIPDMAHLRMRYGSDGAGSHRLITRRVLDGLKRWRGYHRASE